MSLTMDAPYIAGDRVWRAGLGYGRVERITESGAGGGLRLSAWCAVVIFDQHLGKGRGGAAIETPCNAADLVPAPVWAAKGRPVLAAFNPAIPSHPLAISPPVSSRAQPARPSSPPPAVLPDRCGDAPVPA